MHSYASAWWCGGHMIVVEIAKRHRSDATARATDKLIKCVRVRAGHREARGPMMHCGISQHAVFVLPALPRFHHVGLLGGRPQGTLRPTPDCLFVK